MSSTAARLVIPILFLALAGTAQNAFQLTDRPTVQVSGSAEASVAPDRARITMSVTEQGRNVTAAKRVVDSQVVAVQSMLRRAGVADTAIDAAGVRVYRRRVEKTPPGPEVGADDSVVYDVTRDIVVTLVEIDSLDRILDQAIALGVDEVRRVAFFTSAADSLRLAAMRLAADDAKRTARALAARFGRMLGPVFMAAYDFAGGGRVRPVTLEGRGAATGFATGLVTVRASVRAVFELEQ